MELEIDEMLVEIIQNATQKALNKLFEEYNEKFYYCSLITTGEGLCPIISAWSEEALERAASKEDDVEEAKFYLKWSYDDTPYFAYGEEYFEDVNKVFLDRMKGLATDTEKDKEVRLRINSMEKVMHNLDMEGMFGRGEDRLGIVINAEFMPPDFTNTERALRLNPREALNEWLEEIAEEIAIVVPGVREILKYRGIVRWSLDIPIVKQINGMRKICEKYFNVSSKEILVRAREENSWIFGEFYDFEAVDILQLSKKYNLNIEMNEVNSGEKLLLVR